MRLIQLNHYLHTFITNYIDYIVRGRAWKINEVVAYLLCVCTVNNTVHRHIPDGIISYQRLI